MPGIPVTVYLDRDTFNELERISNKKGTPMRDLIARHMRRVAVGVVAPSQYGSGPARGATPDQVDAWVRAAAMGVTNNAIAEQWGVSKSLVSLRMRERGVRRHINPRTPKTTREDAA